MSENREEILANFQACTDIDDLGIALDHLEQSKWNLLEAIQRAMPQDSQTLPSEQTPDVEIIDVRPAPVVNGVGVGVPVILSPDMAHAPSTSFGATTRLLHFHIHYVDNMITLQINDHNRVGDLKMLIFAKTQIPICQQILDGWENAPSSDSVLLSSLNLPHENLLFLTVPEQNNLSVNSSSSDTLSQKYNLVIFDEKKCKEHRLEVLGSKTIGEVKAEVRLLIDITVKNQVWTGWPIEDDRCTLSRARLEIPEHKLSVRPKREYKRPVIVDQVMDSDSSVEEFEDASESFTGEDEMFVEEIGSRKLQPLIPDNVEDETAGCIHFNDEFTNRYGDLHPYFFPGTLEDAIKDSCLKPARERRPLAVYLHHDGSVLSNVFCTELLCFESVMQYLNSNFLVWGWDLTFDSNKTKFLNSVSKSLGNMAAVTVRSIDLERLPALIIIMRMRSNTEIFSVINGNIGVSELLTSLIQAVDVFSDQQRLEVQEEDERAAREMIKIEQDQAYQASLEIDQAKEEAKKQQIMIETQEKRRIEEEKQQEEARKEAERRLLESQLPDEPDETSEGISKIRFRLPSGDFLERRFSILNSLQVVLHYLVVKGYHTENYKVISSWPRRDLTTLDVHSTIQDLKLYPQETLILEER
ncbi:FAS-associated factor 1 [Nilaparvata lugens]|uniref:FAS-associated factor 1 n=1 Tax=Nilaparvata lugens TaxID=108931 RepID=UPI00193E5D2D|nr:FAS-associated factor 1 [Nilaparvata lugens]